MLLSWFQGLPYFNDLIFYLYAYNEKSVTQIALVQTSFLFSYWDVNGQTNRWLGLFWNVVIRTSFQNMICSFFTFVFSLFQIRVIAKGLQQLWENKNKQDWKIFQSDDCLMTPVFWLSECLFDDCLLNVCWMSTKCPLNVSWMSPDCLLTVYWLCWLSDDCLPQKNKQVKPYISAH